MFAVLQPELHFYGFNPEMEQILFTQYPRKIPAIHLWWQVKQPQVHSEAGRVM
jgi:hypothetical protein